MNKTTIKLLLTLSLVTLTQNSQAAIYKCKTASGSIEYLAVPCPKGSAKKDISTISQKKQQQGLGKTKVSIHDIKTVSDGLSNIMRNGFASESLKNLVEDHSNNQKRSNAYRLTEKGAVWQQYLRVTIKPYSSRGIEIDYTASRSSQNARKLSSLELARAEKNFNLSLMDINVHATTIGLKNKASKVKVLGTNKMEWTWKEEGFKCKMKAVVYKEKRSKNKLTYNCKYQGA